MVIRSKLRQATIYHISSQSKILNYLFVCFLQNGHDAANKATNFNFPEKSVGERRWLKRQRGVFPQVFNEKTNLTKIKQNIKALLIFISFLRSFKLFYFAS